MRSLLHKAAFAAALLLSLCGCAQRARLIPERKMVRIYADMFLADQWIRDHRELRASLDTTLFFDPIFARYGYTFADYDYSINYYASKPEQISDIATKVAKYLSSEAERLKVLDETDREHKSINSKNRRLYLLQDFSTDSVRLGQLDSAWYKSSAADSLPIGFLAAHIVLRDRPLAFQKISADTLKAQKDLAHPLEEEDSLSLKTRSFEHRLKDKIKTISKQ